MESGGVIRARDRRGGPAVSVDALLRRRWRRRGRPRDRGAWEIPPGTPPEAPDQPEAPDDRPKAPDDAAARTDAEPRADAAPQGADQQGRGPRARRLIARWAVWGAPLAMLGVVVGVQSTSDHWTILELTVLSPLLAATLAGPALTTVYVVVALLACVLMGLQDGLFAGNEGGLAAQLVRLTGVAVGGVMAVLVSRYNTRRETKLQNVTRVAEMAQRAILSCVPVLSGQLRLAVRYESAAAEAMVGGDLYEVVDSPWGTRLLIGDVRGKGLDAVGIASRVLGCFRVVARLRPDLGAVLIDLDREVAEISGLDDFVTAVVVQIRGDRMDMVNAGHPDPILVRRTSARPLTAVSRRPPLGLLIGGADSTSIVIEPGDRVLLYTDGIAEARHPGSGEFFPLVPAVGAALARPATLDNCLGDLVARVREWTGSALTDDVALLVAEVLGPRVSGVGAPPGGR